MDNYNTSFIGIACLRIPLNRSKYLIAKVIYNNYYDIDRNIGGSE